MLYHVSDITYYAARLAGVLGAAGRGMTTSQKADALRALNDLLDSWNIDPLKIYTTNIQVFNLVANQQSYTMGIDPAGILTANFNAPRPDYISHINLIYQQSSGNPIRIPIEELNDDGWSAVQVQQVYTGIPRQMYNDGAYPFSNLYFWPIPNVATQVEIYAWKSADQFTGETDAFEMPPGYREAVAYNLAVKMCHLFPGLRISPDIATKAAELRYEVDKHNAPDFVMSCDEALTRTNKGAFNWQTGLPQ